MKSTLRTSPPPPGFSQSAMAAASTQKNQPKINPLFIHMLINSESSTGCLEDILILRVGRDMGWSYFSSLAQLHTTRDLDSAFIQRPSKLQQISEICFSLASFVFLLGGFTSQCCWGREKKKLEGNGIFWFPQYEHSTALSQHLLPPSINGLMISAGIPSAPTVRPQIWDPSRHGATI